MTDLLMGRQTMHQAGLAIAQEVAEAHDVPVAELLFGERGPKRVSDARIDLYHALRADGWSLPQIGDFCGGRHHTTVLHGLRK